ncbi:MAG: PilZ domain-containing protein [Pseudobdellovibrionaceae bacterium]
MKKVLIISTSFDEQKKLEEVAFNHDRDGFSFETTASFGQEPSYWLPQPPALVIIQLPDDDLLQSYYFTKLRSSVPITQPLLFLCSQVTVPLMQLSQSFDRVRMMKTPIDGFALYRAVVDNTKDYEPGKQQIHPRYLTDQKVEILSDFHPGKISGVMKNLSLTGAYIEADQLSFPVEPENFIKVSALIGTSMRSFIFDARVVWKKKQDHGMTGFGVMFVNRDDVYDNLMKNI